MRAADRVGVSQFTTERERTDELAENIAAKLAHKSRRQAISGRRPYSSEISSTPTAMKRAYESPAPNVLRSLSSRAPGSSGARSASGAGTACSIFMAKARKRTRFSAAPTTARASRRSPTVWRCSFNRSEEHFGAAGRERLSHCSARRSGTVAMSAATRRRTTVAIAVLRSMRFSWNSAPICASRQTSNERQTTWRRRSKSSLKSICRSPKTPAMNDRRCNRRLHAPPKSGRSALPRSRLRRGCGENRPRLWNLISGGNWHGSGFNL